MIDKMIRRLVKLVEDSDIAQLEFTSWGRKIKITKRYDNNGFQNRGATEIVLTEPRQAAPQHQTAQAVPLSPPSRPAGQAESAIESPDKSDDKYVAIKSPMVGTFYTSPEPNAPPYVEVGQIVSVGQVVCIVEAMKLMNEIESEIEGKVVRRLVENAQPVEFGQTLFLVEPLG
jgi:acetyl-CoA carboxylase biotin carboxyl carrier protein